MVRKSACSTAMSNGKTMRENKAIDLIQKQITAIKITATQCDPDEWLMDHIDSIQHIINDYRNQEFKATEPDPFN